MSLVFCSTMQHRRSALSDGNIYRMDNITRCEREAISPLDHTLGEKLSASGMAVYGHIT
jgi:hypothetical protein